MNTRHNGKQQRLTKEMAEAKWGFEGKPLGCSLCGKVFTVGDLYRWVYMNGQSPSPGNFFVCDSCDQPGIASKVRDALSRYKPHMHEWVLLYQLEENRHKLERFSTGKPYEEWGEDDGPVLWWRMPICEPPYLGDPLCSSWPFDAEDVEDLLWTPIGDATAIMDRWLAKRPTPSASGGAE